MSRRERRATTYWRFGTAEPVGTSAIWVRGGSGYGASNEYRRPCDRRGTRAFHHPAEMSGNHNQSLERALQLVDAAAQAVVRTRSSCRPIQPTRSRWTCAAATS